MLPTAVYIAACALSGAILVVVRVSPLVARQGELRRAGWL